jgi:HSP20 family protein
MTIIRRTNPFGELLSLRQAMDRLFEDSWVRPGSWLGDGDRERGLAVDIRTTPDALIVEAALPGVKPENVDISILDDTLTISGQTSEEKTNDGDGDGYTYREIRRGSFSRSLSLPRGLKSDAASANFENGILRLSIPKADEAKPRQIKISPTTEGKPAQVAAESSAAESSK